MPLHIEPLPVDSAAGVELVRACFGDIIGRALGRRITDAEIDAAVAADPASGLTEPNGWYLAARIDDRFVGGVGVKRIDSATGELQRFYVDPSARGRGVGAGLLTAAEASARADGMSLLRLDTRSDLVEAARLFMRHGFEAVRPFNDDPHVDRWYAKELG
ncbi:acetyltransferase (GNAT) family protein [Stackebrandtia endophytica]|uniref:Acetyltransferase (GNAT) family protein n=1 Tax=Stackebrandtia endophytica TaxID=1496996 RepID=A0A543AUR4_9ACTN|nr:GNAT family N-acetyltransferase [Stackebrandtia endophytica]TQL76287.1 acetyltransferase (GNAT) family protein [Stackebrandtia endophytica]